MRCPSTRQAGRSSRLRRSTEKMRGAGDRRTRVANDTWPKLTSDEKRRPKQQRIAFAKSLRQARKQSGRFRDGPLSTSRNPKIASRYPGRKPRHRRDRRTTLISTGVGVERIGGGEQVDSGVTPPCLPNSDSRRRIPASCPFPRSLGRQLRATPASLAASDKGSEASARFHRSPVQPHGQIHVVALGREPASYATVPAGLADTRAPTWAWLPGQKLGSGQRQGARGRLRYGGPQQKAPAHARVKASCLLKPVLAVSHFLRNG